MNAALQPLVEELKVLDQSVEIGGLKVRVRAVLWSCDLPVMRKALGMLSHNANKGKPKIHNTELLTLSFEFSHLIADIIQTRLLHHCFVIFTQG